MRVRYIDNSSKEGELDLARVKPGDSVRFISDFRKVVGPRGVVFVPKETLGEVTGVGPESLSVLAAGAREAVGDLESSDMEVEVEPHVVAVLVDERDERLNNHRIDDAQRVGGRTAQFALELWDLELALAAGVEAGWPMWQRRAAVRRLRGAARTLARRTSDRAWRALVAGLGYERAAARLPSGASIEVLRQAEQAMAGAFQAEHGRPADVNQRHDALWLVQELYAQVAHESGEDQLTLQEDESGAFQPHGPSFDEYSLDEGPGGSLMPSGGPAGGPAAWERELERVADTLESIRATPDSTWAREMADLGRPYAGPYDFNKALLGGDTPPELPEHTLGPAQPLPADFESQFDLAMDRSRQRPSHPSHPSRPSAPPEPPRPSAPEPPTTSRTPIFWKSQEKWVIAQPGMPVFVKNKGHGSITQVRPDSIVADVEGRPVTSDPRLVYLHAREPLPGMEFATLPEIGEMKRRVDKRRHASCYVTTPTHERDNRPATPYGEVAARGADTGATRARSRHAGARHHSSAGSPGPSGDGDEHPVHGAGYASGLRVRPRSDEARGLAGRRIIGLGPLGVSELKRWLNYPDEFAVISAYQDTHPAKDNQRGHGTLMQLLQEAGYTPGQIRPLRGQYESKREPGKMVAEQSMLVLGMGLQEALAIGRLLDQQSVLYKSPEGVVGAYWTDGSGEVRLALNEGDVAVGEQGAQIRPRAPKEKRRGPPSPKDPWSKARSVGFEFPIDWGRAFKTEHGLPITLDDARRQLGLAEVGKSDVEAAAIAM